MKTRYRIKYYRLGRPYYMVCTRTYLDTFKTAIKHIIKFKAYFFTIKIHKKWKQIKTLKI